MNYLKEWEKERGEAALKLGIPFTQWVFIYFALNSFLSSDNILLKIKKTKKNKQQ